MRVPTADDTTKRVTTAVTFFTTTVPAARRAKVLTEAQPLLSAPTRSKEIWAALLLADYKKEGTLNDAAVNVLYQSQKDLFRDLLLVNSAEELMELLDSNEDGILNEDEQILAFSLIKERMQDVAEELCAIHEYAMYKEMMRGVRAMEADILVYQERMRKRNHRKELSAYHEAGEAKLQRFQQEWSLAFSTYGQESQARVQALQQTHQQQSAQLDERLQRELDFVKVKPKARMRELQTQEKLVAVNERYSEAQKIRNELKVLEVDEQMRVESKVLQDQEKRRVKLRKQQSKELSELQLKNQTGYYALKIKMDQQYTRLQKEIKLYLNDITKNQNLALRLARKVGETRDELRRTKKKSKALMRFITESRAVQTAKPRPRQTLDLPQTSPNGKAIPHGSVLSSVIGRARTSSPLKRNVRNITQFHISGFGSGGETPTAGPRPAAHMLSARPATALHSAKTPVMQSIGALYDENLEPLAANL